MLQRYVMHEDPENPGHFQIGPDLEDDPCEKCGGESTPQICLMDGRYHHHMRSHILGGGGPTALCDDCYEEEADRLERRRMELQAVPVED